MLVKAVFNKYKLLLTKSLIVILHNTIWLKYSIS